VYQTESGKYTCGPSVSPENSFLYNGNARQISSGCTYEILMIRELFFIYKKALDILKMPKKEQDIKISEIYENLLPYRVLENGCIAECRSTASAYQPFTWPVSVCADHSGRDTGFMRSGRKDLAKKADTVRKLGGYRMGAIHADVV